MKKLILLIIAALLAAGCMTEAGAVLTDDDYPPEPEPNRYAEITVTDADIKLMAQLVYREARGECFEGQVAVVEVVLNRVLCDRFPNTVKKVITQKSQFAGRLSTAKPSEVQYAAVYEALSETEYYTTLDTVYFATTARRGKTVSAKIGHHVFCEV